MQGTQGRQNVKALICKFENVLQEIYSMPEHAWPEKLVKLKAESRNLEVVNPASPNVLLTAITL